MCAKYYEHRFIFYKIAPKLMLARLLHKLSVKIVVNRSVGSESFVVENSDFLSFFEI